MTPTPTPGGINIGDVFSPAKYFKSVSSFLNLLLPNILLLSGLIMFIFMIVGGLMIITSAGSGNAEGTGKGKKTITWALIGFILVLFAYIIIEVIETVTGLPIFSPGV